MRLDRLVTIFFNRFMSSSRKVFIPVLMYHSVRKSVEKNVSPYYCTEVTTKKFEQQLNFLIDNEYTIHFLSDIFEVFMKSDYKNNKMVIVTFDDGYENFYRNALPILRKYNVPVTMFIPSGLIAKSNNVSFEGSHLMSWEQVKKCADQNLIEIGSHSSMHVKLIECSNDRLKTELSESKKNIEDQIQKEVTLFSYPFRFPDENKKFALKLCALLKLCGYKISVTTRIGCVFACDNPYLLKRIPVNDYDDSELFEAKLKGHYDWLYSLQYFVKNVRSFSNSYKVAYHKMKKY